MKVNAVIDILSISHFNGLVFEDGQLPPSDIEVMDHLIGYDGAYFRIYRDAVTVEFSDVKGKVIGEGVSFPTNSFIPMGNMVVTDDGEYVDVTIHINDRFYMSTSFGTEEFRKAVMGVNVEHLYAAGCDNHYIDKVRWNEMGDYDQYAYTVLYHGTGKVETYHYND